MDTPAAHPVEALRDQSSKPFPAFCYAPFVSVYFHPVGDVYACCRNTEHRLGSVMSSTLREIWDGQEARTLRRALQENRTDLGCSYCAWQASTNGFQSTLASSYDAFEVSETDPSWPKVMEFGLSNTCNLECVMCNGELSSRIRASEGRAALPTVYGDRFFAELDDWLPHLVHASFLGGEPFLAAESFRVWDRLAVLDTGMRCAVVTNATRYDARVEGVLDALAFDVTVSLDGVTAATVEAIRRHLDFVEALENARRFHEHTRRHGTAFGFNFCLTPHNWHELGPFLAFADGWDADVRVISVSEPGHCLHDIDEGALAEVLAVWEAESARWATRLGRNRHAWDVEVEQIRRVLAERRAGAAPTLRQPARLDGPLVVTPEGTAGPGAARQARARLERWAADGPVATLDLGPDGRVERVTVSGVGGQLAGLDPAAAVGRWPDEVLGDCEALAGRDRFALERRDGDGVADRIVLATNGPPTRGATGSVVRVVVVAGGDGRTAVHLAADRSYDRRRRMWP